LVTTIHERQIVRRTTNSGWGSGSNNAWEIINPNTPGAIGKGALRGIRIRNLHPSGWYASGFQQLRLIIDNRVIASGTMQIPYETVRGSYLNLGAFVLGADYHERFWFSGASAGCDCAMQVNQQRVPFHREFRLQGGWIWHSGLADHRPSLMIDVWYELKGQ